MTDRHGGNDTSGGTRYFFLNAKNSEGRMYVHQQDEDDRCHKGMIQKSKLCCHSLSNWCWHCMLNARRCELPPLLQTSVESRKIPGPRSAELRPTIRHGSKTLRTMVKLNSPCGLRHQQCVFCPPLCQRAGLGAVQLRVPAPRDPWTLLHFQDKNTTCGVGHPIIDFQ